MNGNFWTFIQRVPFLLMTRLHGVALWVLVFPKFLETYRVSSHTLLLRVVPVGLLIQKFLHLLGLLLLQLLDSGGKVGLGVRDLLFATELRCEIQRTRNVNFSNELEVNILILERLPLLSLTRVHNLVLLRVNV